MLTSLQPPDETAVPPLSGAAFQHHPAVDDYRDRTNPASGSLLARGHESSSAADRHQNAAPTINKIGLKSRSDPPASTERRPGSADHPIWILAAVNLRAAEGVPNE